MTTKAELVGLTKVDRKKELHFIDNSKIWDLHIHTNKCPKGTGEFIKAYKNDTKGFVDSLLEILQKNPVSMISFTDHNSIAYEVYEEFLNRNSEITLLPGVEIDYFSDNDDKCPKHLIVYFDVSGLCNIKKLCDDINNLLKETREHDKPFMLSALLTKLSDLAYNFVLSPHVEKQGKRAISEDWLDEESATNHAGKYMDQFFCFWESSGYKSIQKAIEFLDEFGYEERISIVEFSDSDNFEKVNNYLANPNQVFHSLPSYKGLTLVGSEPTRIRKSIEVITDSRKGNFIKKVIFQESEILLSHQLNAIIGGRGSGKSILLDRIAKELGCALLPSQRLEYLSRFDIELLDSNGDKISNNFTIDYFNQSYVSEIFNTENFNEKLSCKFSDAFDEIAGFDHKEIVSNYRSKFIENNLFQEDVFLIEDFNLTSLQDVYPNITGDGLELPIRKKDKVKILKGDDIINCEVEIERVSELIGHLPSGIKEEKNIFMLAELLKKEIAEASNEYNLRIIENSKGINSVIDKFFDVKEGKTKKSLEKSAYEESIRKKLFILSRKTIRRKSLVDAYYKTSIEFKDYYSHFNVKSGFKEKRFIFSKELYIQSPIDFLYEKLLEYYDKVKCKQQNVNLDESNLKTMLEYFIYDKDSILKDSKSYEKLEEGLAGFELDCKLKNMIYYIDDNDVVHDIVTLSPGTQTNILMEYIVYKRTDKPLLIDQPEDNIDNQTIYKNLTDWFHKLKFQRQVIVVTHDANIVINADTENVIIATQPEEDSFKYEYGSLEFAEIMDECSNILDGGKTAVRRRLNKYES